MTIKVVVYNHYTEATTIFDGATESETEAKLIERFEYARRRVAPGDLGLLVEYLNSQQSYDAWIEIDGKAISGEQFRRQHLAQDSEEGRS